MQLSIAGARRVQPPPLWFVTNGEITVGPVRTGLLLRGVVHGRIPEECLIRELRWKSWRGLAQIREVRALRQRQAWGILSAETPAPPNAANADLVLRRAGDAREALLFSLNVAVKRTGASVGLLHRVDRTLVRADHQLRARSGHARPVERIASRRRLDARRRARSPHRHRATRRERRASGFVRAPRR